MNTTRSIARRLLGPAIALSTAVVILTLSIVPFLSPGWIAFEQGRAQSAAWTGYDPADLRAVTDSIVGDLVFVRGDFDVELDGAAVLTAAERSHMRDVRGVFAGLGLLAVAGAIVLVLAALRVRGTAARARAWTAVRRGAGALAVLVGALGVLSLVAFDTAFELFHRLFFAAGTYDFDPRTSRLVQLFPDAFWSETATVVGLVVIATAIGVALIAGRRAAAASSTGAALMPDSSPGVSRMVSGDTAPSGAHR